MKCTQDGCDKEADYTFVWPWGTDGACCQDHVPIVQQQARNVRGEETFVSFSKLNPDRPKEVTRDERIGLHTRALVAEAEMNDAKERASRLFSTNSELTAENRQLRARTAQFEADVKAMREALDAAIVERDKALRAADAVRVEMQDRVDLLTAERDQLLQKLDVYKPALPPLETTGPSFP